MTKQELSYRRLLDNGGRVLRALVKDIPAKGMIINGESYVLVRRAAFDEAAQLVCKHPTMREEPEDEQRPRPLYGYQYTCTTCGVRFDTLNRMERE